MKGSESSELGRLTAVVVTRRCEDTIMRARAHTHTQRKRVHSELLSFNANVALLF